MSSILDIKPVDHYETEVRPYFLNVISEVTYDDILVKSTEHLMNKLDEYLLSGVNTKQKYQSADAHLQNFMKVITSKSYISGKAYVTRATQKEKDMLAEMTKKISDLIMIIKCSQPDEVSKEKFNKERLNYNSIDKENILPVDNKEKFNRPRIPNI